MQQGGSQYGVPPEMPPFAGTGSRGTHMIGISGSDHLQQQPEAASPISSRPPARNFEELMPVSGTGFPDDDALVAGEEAERGSAGNRWPRQETLALLKIRSEMDAAFRDATLKGPLWEDVSRKLGELGYNRSSKKCKEKFENVHKYYKRTKEGRAGRQDGKSYRFFSQLEALHNTNTPPPITSGPIHPTSNPSPAPISVRISPNTSMVGPSGIIQAPPVSAAPPTQLNMPGIAPDLMAGPATGISGSAAGISFSSNSSSSDSDSEDEIEVGPDTRKRKRSGSNGGGGGGSRKMMVFFEGLMKQVMEKQEQMQQRFLEAIEKREQDRMIREEAWKRQEMVRLTREHEIMAHERAISSSRDAAVIEFLQKITGQTIQVQPPVIIPAAPVTIPVAPPPQPTPPPPPRPQQQEQLQTQLQNTEIIRHSLPPPSSEIVLKEQQEIVGSGMFDPASSRWPKSEVLALIKLRSELENRYQEAGPKGPLWEEISAGMQRMGYNRSAKRCKEKWENINKYFKKVKESNKKRPEDAKTCPYFHQLDALYRKKILSSGGGSSSSLGNQSKKEQEIEPNPNKNPQECSDMLAIMPPQPPQSMAESEAKSTNTGTGTGKNGGNPDGGSSEGTGLQVQGTNGGLPASFFEGGGKKKTL
ncbi:GT-2-like 1 isoform X2 [Tasmannia lanceolata]|uniref:GT-2-like 1 isoform X2 n=1 Tax=Tasmannia lanceolata TaxID=3420 RepID=UPI004063D2FB